MLFIFCIFRENVIDFNRFFGTPPSTHLGFAHTPRCRNITKRGGGKLTPEDWALMQNHNLSSGRHSVQ